MPSLHGFRFVRRLLLALHLPLLISPLLAAEPPLLVVNAPTPSESIHRARFLPSGKSLVTISADKTVRVWDVATGTVTRVIRLPIGPGVEGKPYALAVTRDGDTAAVAGIGPQGRGRVHLISLQQGKIERTFDGHVGYVYGVAFSPDGDRLVSVGDDRTARVWNVANGRELTVLEGHTDIVYGVVFSPDGKSVATASLDKTARVWNAATGKETARLVGHRDRVRAIDWSEDGKQLATGSWDGTARLWTPEGRATRIIGDGKQAIFGVTFAPGGKRLGTVSGAQRTQDDPYKPTHFQLHDLSNGNLVASSKPLDGNLNEVSFSPDGKQAAVCGGYLGSAFLLNTSDGKQVGLLRPLAPPVTVVGWAADGQGVYWGSDPHGNVQSTQQRELLHEFRFDKLNLQPVPNPLPPGTVRNRMKTNANTGIGGFSAQGFLYGRNGVIVSRITLEDKVDARRSTPSLSPDDSAVVFGSEMGAWVHRTSDGRRLNKLSGHSGTVLDAVFSADGKYIVTGGGDRTVRVWKFGESTPLVSLFVADTEWIAWTPEGYYAASPGGEKLVGWQINNGLDKSPTFHPAERFHDSLYRPDVIQRLLEEGSVDRALQAADKAAGKRESKKIDVKDVEPPRVSITNKPRPNRDGKVTIEATAVSPTRQGITKLTLLVNGRPYLGDKADRVKAGANATETDSWRGVALLPDRVNKIKVMAYTGSSFGGSEEILVQFAGEGATDRPKLHLLTVAVSKYQNRAVRPLQYSGKGADKLQSVFVKHSKPSPYGDVATATPLRDENATKQKILGALDALAVNAKPTDTVIIYLSGHGTRAKDKPDQWLFCPVEFDPAKEIESGLTDQELQKKLNAIRSDRLVVLIDACNSGAVARLLKREGSDLDLLCSSLPDQLSQDGDINTPLPLFTGALCEHLADPNLVVRISGDELVGVPFGAVATAVINELFGKAQRRQTPAYHPSARGPLFITDPK